ncbi:MAG: iron-sulfur cluster assembly scaffold protein [Promethearchaeota archaeon]
MDRFDKFIEDLQREIDEETRRDFSERVIELAQKPENWGVISDATVQVCYEGPCGDTMKFYLKIDDNDVIEDISFTTDGCAPTVAAGSQATILAKGRHIDTAYKITNRDILDALGKLPPEHLHCPVLAETTLKRAIEKYKALKDSKHDDGVVF